MNMEKTMLFNGIRVPVLSCDIRKHELRPLSERMPEPLLMPLGPEPTTQRGRDARARAEKLNRMLEHEYAQSVSRSHERPTADVFLIDIEFPTFRWESVGLSMKAGAVITEDDILAGSFDSWTLLLPDGSNIIGRLTEKRTGERAATAEVFNRALDGLKAQQRKLEERKAEISKLSARAEADGLQAMLETIMARQEAECRARAADDAETHRLLHRNGRKLDGVPPAMDKLALAAKDMAAATKQFRQLVKMPDPDWEIFDRMELRNRNQSWVARDLGVKPYKISRAWKRIKEAWAAAGYPLADKVTLGNAVMGDDGVVYKKPAMERKGRGR